MKFPKHISLSITHNEHNGYYETAEETLLQWKAHDAVDIQPEDEAEILRTGEIWRIQWYPNTPVGFHVVAAATLERALELANEIGEA